MKKKPMTKRGAPYPSVQSIPVPRGYNFGAGPAMLPRSILEAAREDLLNWQQTGMSILEIGHRTEVFQHLLREAENSLRRILAIPENYRVLFLSGPARMLFSMIPLNFLAQGEKGSYLVTGIWSQMAYQEAARLKKAVCVASGEEGRFSSIPNPSTWGHVADSRYFYYTPNETVNGIYCPKPVLSTELPRLPLIADMTSCLLAEPINVADYDLIFAGAQKNIANAGLTLVIVRDQFIDTINQLNLPTLTDFRTHVKHQSLYATPPTFNCYLAHKMFAWIEEKGGIEALYTVNKQKAAKLYQYIDNSAFYSCPIDKNDRSLFNVCFNVPLPEQEEAFVTEAAANNLLALKGHRFVGGLRASLYNAMPMEGVDCLIEFMQAFALRCAP